MLLKAMLAYLRIQLFFPPLTTRKIILDKTSKHCLCSHTGSDSCGIGLAGGYPPDPLCNQKSRNVLPEFLHSCGFALYIKQTIL